MSIDSKEDRSFPQLDLERRQDEVLGQLDELNERIENLIELYTRLRTADQAASADHGERPAEVDSEADDFGRDEEDSATTTRAA